MSTRLPVVLVVEDNEDDLLLTQRALAHSTIPVDIRVVRDGEECLSFLNREGSFKEAPSPDLILLDLNMPKMDGREVLAEIAHHEQFRHLPVVILTTSKDESEILGMYRLRCSSYVIKAFDWGEFQRAVQSIIEYWFGTVALPTTRIR